MYSTQTNRTGILMIVMAAAIALTAFLAVPGTSAAATYAYVNTEGIVMTHVATDPDTAIATAPGRSLHSGVMLISDASDTEVIGEDVDGV